MTSTCGTYIYSSSEQKAEENYANKQQFKIAVPM